MSEEKLKLEDLLGDANSAPEQDRIEYVAIVGCGVMGQGIAWTISAAGLDVLIIEKDEDHLEKAKASLEASMEREIARWAMTKSEMKSILGKIKWSLDFDELKECDLIIEAVGEKLPAEKIVIQEI